MVCLRGISSHLMVEAVAQRMCGGARGRRGLRRRPRAGVHQPGHRPVSAGRRTYEELYRKADKALYCAKRAGGGTYAFYRDEPRVLAPALLPAGFPTPPCSMVSSSPWRSNTPTLR
ncbi:MAG: hypothetical protein ACLTMP_00580 [Eggerthella lenta]